MSPDIEELIDQAEVALDLHKNLRGAGNILPKVQKLVANITAESLWLDEHGSDPAKHHYVPAKQTKIKKWQIELAKALHDLEVKAGNIEEEKEPRELSLAEQKGLAIIDIIRMNDPIACHPSMMLAQLIPDVYNRFVRNGERWFIRHEGVYLELTTEAHVVDTVRNAWISTAADRAVGTAKRQARMMGNDLAPDVPTVLDTWDRAAQNADSLFKFLPVQDDLKILDHLLPIQAGEHLFTLDRMTGEYLTTVPDGSHVLLPVVKVSDTGESRALDALVTHHFKTQPEVDAFYLTCGISLFGYGIPNLIFLLGSGGSGKDQLFNLMRSVHGSNLTCDINPLTLSGSDEANDLVRLQSARFALCSFESSSYADGSFKPAVLKSITSGGTNPLTARAKYAKEAVSISYTGSLWLYGNKVPDITGHGDIDGIDRRFAILPMTKKLPDVAPPKGFNDWTSALESCSPVFAYRCMAAFVEWHKKGAPGKQDVRERILPAWRDASHDALVSGSKYGALRKILRSDGADEMSGLNEITIFDVLEHYFASNRKGSTVPRDYYMDILRSTMDRSCHFPGEGHMEAIERDGRRVLPLIFVPDALEASLSEEKRIAVHHILKKDPSWNESLARMKDKMFRGVTVTHANYRPDREQTGGE